MTEAPEYTQEYLDRGRDRIGLHVYRDPTTTQPPRTPGPVVVIWPAMGVPARYYRPFAGELLRCGLGVVVADLRGTGSSTPPADRASRYGLADLVGDVDAVQQALKERLDGRTTLLLGHSLGGQTALLHVARGGTPVDGVVLVAVGLPYFRAYPARRAAWVLGLTQPIAIASRVLGYWPGWKFGGRQSRGVIRDWAYTARHGGYPSLDGFDAEAGLASAATPVLAISVDGDEYTPPSTMDHLVGKLATARVVREHHTTGEAGGPLDHFRWVRASAALATRVAAFAAEVTDRPGSPSRG